MLQPLQHLSDGILSQKELLKTLQKPTGLVARFSLTLLPACSYFACPSQPQLCLLWKEVFMRGIGHRVHLFFN